MESVTNPRKRSYSHIWAASGDSDRAPRHVNTGSGAQSIHYGQGNQNITTNSIHYNGPVTIAESTADANNTKFLRDLRLTDPRKDKTRIERTKGGLVHDSYSWIISHPDFLKWRNDPESLLWIKGDPGKGKTMLLCGIIDELRADMELKCQPVFFFCQATDESLNKATAVIRGLLYLLLVHRPSLIPVAREDYDHAGEKLFTDNNAWDTLCELFTKVLDETHCNDLVIVIDALDECVHGLNELLEFIHQLSSYGIRMIISSRNWTEIEERMLSIIQKISIPLELNEMAISQAVKNYIEYKTTRLAVVKKYTDAKRKYVQAYLTSNAKDTFLWVALVCQQLENSLVPKGHDIPKILEGLPPGLDKLYDRMLDRVARLESYAAVCLNVLAVISTVYRPMRLGELKFLIQLPSETADVTKSEDDEGSAEQEDFLRDIVRLCGSILVVDNNTIYFVHQSAKDFLLKTAESRIMPLGIAQVHNSVLSNSLRGMSDTLRRDIYDIRAPGVSIDDIGKPFPDPLEPVKYSCVHWMKHLGQAEPTKEQLQYQVYEFLREHYLHLIEALSLLGSVSEGIMGMIIMLSAFQSYPTLSDQTSFIEDALRFIQYHRTGIETATLQIYCSALIFSPTQSLIRQLFQEEQPAWIPVKPKVREKWSACFMTLEGHSNEIEVLMIMPNGTKIVSQTSKDISEDKFETKLWDTRTGQCNILDSPGHVLDVLADSTTLLTAHGCDDAQKLLLWNTLTDERWIVAKKPEIQGGPSATRAAISRDGKKIALANLEGPVQLLDAKTGRCLHTLGEATLDLLSVVFSPDTITVAIQAESILRVWNTTNGQCLWTFECTDTKGLFEVAFSADGKQLVQANGNGSVQIREVKTGQCESTFRMGSSPICLSHDGSKILAKGSKLWDTRTRRCVGKLEGLKHDGLCLSTFSYDSMRVATIACDDRINLWDLTACQEASLVGEKALGLDTIFVDESSYESTPGRLTLVQDEQRLESRQDDKDNHFAQLSDGRDYFYHGCSVTFSHDHLKIISASGDGLKFWDADTGVYLNTIRHEKIHERWPEDNCIATLDNGQVLLAKYDEEHIEIWNANDGLLKHTLRVSSKGGQIGLSNDGAWFAICTEHGPISRTIQIWDVSQWNCVVTLKIPGFDWRDSDVAFSEKGSQLLTDAGAINWQASLTATIDPLKPLEPTIEEKDLEGYTVDTNGWIMKDGQKLLWLPTDYQPQMLAAIAVRGSTIAVGLDGGRALVLKFDDDMVDRLMKPNGSC